MESLKFYTSCYALFTPFQSMSKAGQSRFAAQLLQAVLQAGLVLLLLMAFMNAGYTQLPSGGKDDIGVCSDFPDFTFAYEDLQGILDKRTNVSINARSCSPVDSIVVGANLSDVLGDSMQLHVTLSPNQDWGKGTKVETNLEGELLRIVIKIPLGTRLRPGELLSFHVTSVNGDPVALMIKSIGGIVIVDNIMGRSIQKSSPEVSEENQVEGMWMFAHESSLEAKPHPASILDLQGRHMATFDPRNENGLRDALQSLPGGIYVVVDPNASLKEDRVRKIFKY